VRKDSLETTSSAGACVDLSIHQGAGAYICGEETSLIESLEGKRGQPRLRPPFPANAGAWGKPTVVNNVETLANVPYVLSLGSEDYAKIGSEGSPGMKIFCVSGPVNRPGGYELPLGTTLREIIFTYAGGIRDGRRLKAVIPGGASTPMLTNEHLDVKMDFNSLLSAGSMLGSGAIIVMDESACMVMRPPSSSASLPTNPAANGRPAGKAQTAPQCTRLLGGSGSRRHRTSAKHLRKNEG
jgi:NADH-quinone oxidoreductase subunit F